MYFFQQQIMHLLEYAAELYITLVCNMSVLLRNGNTFPCTIHPINVNQTVAICKCIQIATSRKQFRHKVFELIYMYAHARICSGVPTKIHFGSTVFDKTSHLYCKIVELCVDFSNFFLMAKLCHLPVIHRK